MKNTSLPTPNAVSGLSVVNQSCFSPDIYNCMSVPVALPLRGPSGFEGLCSLLILIITGMFHRAVNKFQNKWHWNEELNKFWGDVVQGGRNILGSRYGEREVVLKVLFYHE